MVVGGVGAVAGGVDEDDSPPPPPQPLTLKQCVVCLEDVPASAHVSNAGACAHTLCTSCFAARTRVGASAPATDLTDPFACPVCKAQVLLVRVPGRGDVADEWVVDDLERATRYARYLWAASARPPTEGDDSDRSMADADEETPPMLTFDGHVPCIVYHAYWLNRSVLLGADMITNEEQRSAMMQQDLVPVADTPRARGKRGAAVAALGRMHVDLRKRRRLDVDVLEEARSFVDLLDGAAAAAAEDAEGDGADGGVLYLVTTLRQNSHMWMHTDFGTAVAVLLRKCSAPQTSCALIRISDESSRVLAAVTAQDSGARAPTAVMRSIRRGREVLTPEAAAALTASVSGMQSFTFSDGGGAQHPPTPSH